MALFWPIYLKKHLPILKAQKFLEISNFFHSLGEGLADLESKTKECHACKSKITFQLVIGTNTGKDLSPKKNKIFCRQDGLREWRKLLENFSGVLIFAEPDLDKISGSFFYEPQDLKTHAYSEDDKKILEGLISESVSDFGNGKIAWLTKEVIGICQNPPLFKAQAEPEVISIEELMRRLDRILWKDEQKYKKDHPVQ